MLEAWKMGKWYELRGRGSDACRAMLCGKFGGICDYKQRCRGSRVSKNLNDIPNSMGV